jgi:hypothetical protein
MREGSQPHVEAMSQEDSIDADEHVPSTAVEIKPVLTITGERLKELHMMGLEQEEQDKKEKKDKRKIKAVLKRVASRLSRKSVD